ncbi:lamina-associated polypeptide 2, isoforms alpha/zeta-like [Dendropsophus ebraccatus]|uniref:lamina-associated polypeptide 2, isoforms alpha/zeta-like n=1 Tax=Dendropsophus ebraccatus TaxID=150705 RepID=UPI003831FC4A
MCHKKLHSSYSKSLCNVCLSKVMEEESPSFMKSIKGLIRDEVTKAIPKERSAASTTASTSASSASTSRTELSVSHSSSPVITLESDPEEEGECQGSSDNSSDELSGKPLFPVEKVESLVKAVRATMNLEESKETLSIQDKMFESLAPRRKKVFPIHQTMKDLIEREWKKPDKKFFVPRAMKRKYPFDETETDRWDRAPMIDPPVSKITRNQGALPFEDTGTLKDPMDRRADSFLRKDWEAAAAIFKPMVASTSVGRSVKLWLEELESNIREGTPREDLLKAFPTIFGAVDFMTDASADTLRLAARATAVSNSARRAIWVKDWKGEAASKSKLCALPCQGELLFGPALDSILEKASDRKRKFPSVPPPPKRPFHGKGRGGAQTSYPKQRNWKAPGKGRGYLFSKINTSKKDDKK